MFLTWKQFWIWNLPIGILMEKMQPLALENNLVPIYRSIIHKYKFSKKIDLSNFWREDGNGFWINLYRTIFIDSKFGGKKPDSCFKRNHLWITRRTSPILSLKLFWHIRFPLQGTKCTVWQSSILKVWSCWLLPWWTKMNLIFLENKRLDSEKIQNLVHFPGISVSKTSNV